MRMILGTRIGVIAVWIAASVKLSDSIPFDPEESSLNLQRKLKVANGDSFNIFQRGSYCEKVQDNVYQTVRVWNFFAFFYRLFHSNSVPGSCGSPGTCATICRHVDCADDFENDTFQCTCFPDRRAMTTTTCGSNAVCMSDVCTCPSGFGGDPLAECTERNQCETSAMCGPNGTCQNDPTVAGSMRCVCNSGYVWDGLDAGCIDGCSSSAKTCISTTEEFNMILENLADGVTIALCGDGDTIETTSASVLEASGATLCCAGASCRVQSTGSDRNLVVRGTDSTIQGITFLNGVSRTTGGNVAILGAGNHRILDSEFQNGESGTRGGNLFVSTSGNVLIRHTSFINGTAGIGGGGLAVSRATNLNATGAEFIRNRGPEGAGLFSSKESGTADGQIISIKDSKFISNEGGTGGGFLVTQLGVMPSLSILTTEFSKNTASTTAGAGAIVAFLDDLSLVLDSNSGTNNTGQMCNDIFALQGRSSADPLCIPTGEDFPF